MTQLDLLDPPAPALPEGMRYHPELISAEEEHALLQHLPGLPFSPFQFRGHEGKRRTVSFGWRYDFGDARLHAAEPMPHWLQPLRRRAAEFAGLAEHALAHALITEYAPGAPIGWHRDRPAFDQVIGVSLGSPCTFRMRRKVGPRWERRAVELAPRSAYLLTGEARSDWEHSIPPVEALRYSVTFRTLSPSLRPPRA